MTPVTKELMEAFEDRTKAHTELVLYFAGLLHYDYPEHDHSKFHADIVGGFVLANARSKLGLTLDDEDKMVVAKAIFNHVKQEAHHPEYWDETQTWDNFSINPAGFKHAMDGDTVHRVDARKMDERSMVEMCCDLCAVSHELGDNPRRFLNENLDKRWLFTPDQIKFMTMTIGALWQNHMQKRGKTDQVFVVLKDGLSEAL